MGLPMIPSPTKPTFSGILVTSGRGTHGPPYPPLQRVVLQREAVSFPLQAQAVQNSVFGQAEEAVGGGGVIAVDRELYLAPVHPLRALRELDVRDRRAVPDQQDGGNISGPDAVPPPSRVRLARLVVGPGPGRQVDVARRLILQERGDEEVRAEEVLVLDEPGGPVLGVLEEERAQHGVAVARGQLRLRVDVGHEPVAQLHDAPEVVGEPFAVLPRLGGGSPVAAGVGAEHAEAEPAAVEVRGARVGEPPDKVAPEGEPAQPEREAAAQGPGHRAVGVLRVAAPVERVALAAGPGAAGVDGAVAGNFSGDLRDRLVVAQRVEVVLQEAATPRVVYPRQGSRLAEVRREDTDPHLQEVRQLPLVPRHGLRVAEVEDDVSLLDGLLVQLVVRVEVRKLPQAYAETVVFEVGDNRRWVPEARIGEL